MCQWGNTVCIEIDGQPIDVDRCIAPIVAALNACGMKTRASCCGHGEQPGNIALWDGREIIIAANHEQARVVSAAFPPIN